MAIAVTTEILEACAHAAHEANRAYCRTLGYGPEKDPAKKTHPCMLPYDQLPEEQRKKDRIFIDVVRSVAAALGAV